MNRYRRWLLFDDRRAWSVGRSAEVAVTSQQYKAVRLIDPTIGAAGDVVRGRPFARCDRDDQDGIPPQDVGLGESGMVKCGVRSAEFGVGKRVVVGLAAIYLIARIPGRRGDYDRG